MKPEMRRPAVLPGKLIAGRYRIEEELGRGRTGAVYGVQDTQLQDEPMALKIFYSHVLGSPQERQRLHQEMFLVRQLAHPNIIQLYDVDLRDDDESYFTMERVNGVTLRRFIECVPRDLKENEILEIITQVHYGLAAAHEKGIVHRDLKPENIIIAANGLVKLVDFGCGFYTAQSQRLTQTGVLIGTPAYMAPEQFRGEIISSATDLYALGILTYELITGKVPFTSEALYTLAENHQSAEPDYGLLAKTGVTQELQRFVRTCLEKEPSKRHSASNLLASISQETSVGLSGETIASLVQSYCLATRDSSSSKRREWTINVLLIVVTLVQIYIVDKDPEVARNRAISVMRLESRLGRELLPMRYFAGMPDISYVRHDTFYRALEAEDTAQLQLWCDASMLTLSKNEKGNTLLHELAQRPEVLSRLENIGRCFPAMLFDVPNAKGDTPLRLAIREEHPDAVRVLINSGANPNARQPGQPSVLDEAIKIGNPLVLRALATNANKVLQLNANRPSRNPLHVAAAQGNLPLVEELVRLGLDTDSRDREGATPLMSAAVSNLGQRFEIIGELISQGGSCASRDNQGRSVFEVAPAADREKLEKLCRGESA